jgi:hypothetical protein
MHTLSCIKCGSKYQSADPDPYYCAPCNEERKTLAAQVDAKMAGRTSKEVVSDLKAYEAEAKIMNTPDGRTVSFARIKL